MVSYIAGSVLGGAGFGVLCGLAGRPLAGQIKEPEAALLLIAALLAGVVLDSGAVRVGLPSWRRQVNDRWMYSYRGPVWGFAFGLQLGTGVVTIITTATVYLTFVAAFLTATLTAGLVIGTTFGLVRAATILVAAPVGTQRRLIDLHNELRRLAPLAHRLAITGQASIAVFLAVSLTAT